ncbi:hypothetical protein [Candidatus Albibeggiatoa sp. nov. BB20]|uniref:hypothetical protein n=1 Tax=Candidatus Albibeggiatoa sp. nov. BB20 TaxID=3162723 RepID=UPI00336576AF
MTDYQPNIVHQGGQTLIGGLSRVFHCNHYNAHLQMVVQMTKGIPNHEPERLLVDAATPLIQHLQQGGYSQDDLIQEFALCGFGVLQQYDDNTWYTPHSHYGETTYSHGKPAKSCFFNSGYIQALINQQVEEFECQMLGAEQDKYVTTGQPLQVSHYLTLDQPLQTDVPARFDFDGCQHLNTRVDEAEILAAVQGLPLYGRMEEGETGLIDAFGVVLTNHFSDYYNRISYETYFAMRQAGLPEEDSKEMFIQSGHICAFNTFGGIMSSPEWHAVIEPMCDSREDWFHGMIAVINALGWGLFRVEKIDIEKELIIRVYNSYEGIGFRRIYPATDEKNISFLGMGGVLGLAHLLWKVDIREKPTLNHEFYVTQFNNPEKRYNVVQTHAIAANDEYDRFVVYK